MSDGEIEKELSIKNRKSHKGNKLEMKKININFCSFLFFFYTFNYSFISSKLF